jgi:hypothetical protein
MGDAVTAYQKLLELPSAPTCSHAAQGQTGAALAEIKQSLDGDLCGNYRFRLYQLLRASGGLSVPMSHQSFYEVSAS